MASSMEYSAFPSISTTAFLPSLVAATASFLTSSMVLLTVIPRAVDSPTAGSASMARIFLSG